MRALIDAHETGNETYIRGLLDGFAQIGSLQMVAVADPRIVAPPFSPVPTVLTVHDVSFARYPEAFTVRDRSALGALMADDALCAVA